MPSGARSIVINTAERATSTDVNRLQALGNKALMELLRYSLDVGAGTDDVAAAGSSAEDATLDAPLTAEVVSGLCVVPGLATLALGVAGGLLCAVFPDAALSPDDSVYKYVRDDGGLPSVRGLAMSAGDPTNPRIDVIECQPVVDPDPETDNRDVFNPTTSLFTATTITKTQGYTLSYRVRSGVPGSGFPGVAQGWLPLCVALVPAGATSCDAMTFWDVRPLVNDRIFGTSPVELDLPRRTKLTYSSNIGTGSQCLTSGVAEVSSGSRRLGGQLRRGSPGTDFDQAYVDFGDGANQERGFSAAGFTPALCFMYLLTPFGLPRWARYTDASSGSRVPRSPRGIPLLSKVYPSHVRGLATAPIGMPASWGFGSSGPFAQTEEATCFGATTYGGGIVAIQATAGRWTSPSFPVAAVEGVGLNATTVASGSNGATLPQGTIHVASTTGFPTAGFLMVDGSLVIYTGKTSTTFTGCTSGTATLSTGDVVQLLSGSVPLQENIHFPAGATRLRVAFSVQVDISNDSNGAPLAVQPALGIAEVGNTLSQYSLVPAPTQILNTYDTVGDVGVTPVWVVELELPNHYPNTETGNPWVLSFLMSLLPSGWGYALPYAQVVGWMYE